MAERSEKIYQNEVQRKQIANLIESLTTKGLTETYEEKNFMREAYQLQLTRSLLI